MRRKSIALGSAMAVTILVAIVLWVFFLERPEDSPKVTIAQFGDLLLYMPLYVATDENLFSKRELDVEIVSTGGDDKTYAAVLSGGAQFGVADPTFVAIAHERGQSGKVIALLIDGVPNYGVATSLQSERIKSASDLSGKTVATVPAPSTSYALVRKLYESAGLKPSILQVAPSGLVPSLTTGKADYALLIEPWVSAVVREGGTGATHPRRCS
jgi:NitT/TauT family transport system substrate-binding protein